MRRLGWLFPVALGLFLLGMISKKANNPIAVTGVLLGLLVISWMTFSPKIESLQPFLKNHFNAFLIPVFGTLTILLVGLIISGFKKNVSNSH